MGISFLQIISLLPALQPRWPRWMTSFCNAFSLINLDVSHLFELQCMVSSSGSTRPFVRVWALIQDGPAADYCGAFAASALANWLYGMVFAAHA